MISQTVRSSTANQYKKLILPHHFLIWEFIIPCLDGRDTIKYHKYDVFFTYSGEREDGKTWIINLTTASDNAWKRQNHSQAI